MTYAQAEPEAAVSLDIPLEIGVVTGIKGGKYVGFTLGGVYCILTPQSARLMGTELLVMAEEAHRAPRQTPRKRTPKRSGKARKGAGDEPGQAAV